MSLAPYVQILGRGPGRSRALTFEEAHAAVTLILRGDAAPEAVDALLMLLSMKGETAPELAGFVATAHQSLGAQTVRPALDWPSYAAGRTRGLPWFLLAAKLVAVAGFPVVLHGWNSDQQGHASVRPALHALDIPCCDGAADVAESLRNHTIAYVPWDGFRRHFLSCCACGKCSGCGRALTPCCGS
jgi:anthranilate phosphoribosyltransferase